MSTDTVQRRRALEALRAGVPNRDAVAALGSSQIGVEDRFTQLLDRVPAGTGESPGGMVIGGGFGSGKSHVLEHLAHRALDAGFVVSKVVISKETALHDPAEVFRAAIDDARVPGKRGSAIDEVAGGLDTGSPAYADLYRWLHSDDAPVNAEVARWVRGDRDDPAAPLCAVLTTVDDFEAQVLIGKNDVELVPKKLRQKGTAEHDLLASQAEARCAPSSASRSSSSRPTATSSTART